MNNENIFLIAYDISDNKKRNKISKLLERFGYERIQFSVFTGVAPPQRYKELWKRLAKIIEDNPDADNRIICFSISRSAFRNMKIIGNFNADIDYLIGTKFTEII